MIARNELAGIDTGADLRLEVFYFDPEQPPSEIGQSS
jgi:hypothetical protein